MARKAIVSTYHRKSPTKRPGIHSKTKNSRSKGSKHYKKKYRGQGR